MHKYHIVFQLVDEYGEGVLLDVVTPIEPENGEISATVADFLEERYHKFQKNVISLVKKENEK